MNNYSSYHDNDSVNKNHNLHNSLASVQPQRTNIDPSNYAILHQSLSTASESQTLVHDQRDVSAKNYYRTSINDDIVTIDHHDADASFILPNLYELPEDIRIRVMDNLVDIPTMVSLEETKRLNWWVNKKLPCSKLYPLVTSGDGNCLLHATSLAMWGFHDHSLSMRKALNETLITSKPNNSLYRRWRWTQSVQNKKYGLVFSEQEWNEEWSSLLRLSSAEPRVSQIKSSDTNTSVDETNNSKSNQTNPDLSAKSSTQSTRQYYESLEEFHVYVLANNIRRPIIIYSDTILRTNDGEAISPVEFGGIYLPLEIPPDKCHKQPIFLAFDAAHFSALLPMEQNSKPISKTTYRIPLIDIDTFDILPIHFFIDPGLNFQWPIDEELSDDKINYYTNYGENRMDVLEKYLNLSKEYFPLNNLFSQTIKTKNNDRIPTTDTDLSHEFNTTTPTTNKKSSRSSLHLFSKIFRRTFIEPFSSTKRLSLKHRHHHSINDPSNLPIIHETAFQRRRSSPLLNYDTNIVTIIVTNFQPKRPKSSDNMIKNYIDKCMNEYHFEKNQKQINHENENLQNIEPLTNTNEVNTSKIISHYSDSTDTSSPNHRYHSSSTINPYCQDLVSVNASIDTSKTLNEKETKRKLPSIPLDSLNKTIPSIQHPEKNSNIDDLLPIENNQLIQSNSLEITNDQSPANLEYHVNSISNKYLPSQKLITSSLKRQQSSSSDNNPNNSAEDNQPLNDFVLTNININKRTQILNSISNITQQKRF